MSDDRLLTAAEVGELLSVPESWVREQTRRPTPRPCLTYASVAMCASIAPRCWTGSPTSAADSGASTRRR